MAGKGTTHHRIHFWTGLVMILSLPFVLCCLLCAIPDGAAGFKSWIGSTFGAVSLFIFMSAALWYCKLEFDEVIMDYFDGGFRSFAAFANRAIGFIVWIIAVYAIYKLSFGA